MHFPANTDTTFYYGLGGWQDQKGMMEFAGNFDSIIIVRNGQVQRLTMQGEIVKYLLKQRHGFAKRLLTIEAK